jgi:hypothetical protein
LCEPGHFDIPDPRSRMLAQNLIGFCEHFQQPGGAWIGSGASREQGANVLG